MLINTQRRRADRQAVPDASLILDFARGVGRMGGQGISVASLLTTTRATPGWAINDNGVLVPIPANTARRARQPGAGGLLIERATTNYALFSSNLNASAWAKSNGMTAAANFAPGMDGTPTASFVVDNAAAGAAAGMIGQTVAIPATTGQWWTVGIGLIPVLGRRVKLFAGIAGGSSPSGGNVVFDLQTGAVISQDAGIVGRIRPAPGGYAYVSVSLPNTYGGGALVMQITRENDAASPIWFYADRARFEPSTAPSQPSAITTSGVELRASDQVAIDLTAASSARWFNPAQGTFAVDVDLFGPVENDQSILSLVGTGANYINLGRQAYSGSTYVNAINGVAFANNALQAFGSMQPIGNLPRRVRVAMSYAQGGYRLAMGGAFYEWGTAPYAHNGIVDMVGSNPGGVPAGLTSLQLGQINNSQFLDGLIRSLTYIPVSLGGSALSNLVL